MAKNYLSIDISDSRVNCVIGRSDNNNIFINKVFHMDNVDGYFNDGEFIDVQAFARDFKNELKKNKVKVKDAIVTLPQKKVEMIEKKIERVEEKLIYEMIKIELLSDEIDIDQYEINLIVDPEDNTDELTYNVKVYLMPRKLVEDIKQVLKECGLKPVFLDINTNGIKKLHKTILDAFDTSSEFSKVEKDDLTVMYIDVANTFTQVNIMKGRKQELVRTQENQIYESLTFQREAKDEEIEGFINSLELTTRYYKSKQVGNYIDEIFFYGFDINISRLDEVREVIGERLGTNTNPLLAVNGVVFGNIDEDFNASYYVNAMSALIRV